MGYDAGFDLYPPLGTNDGDQDSWCQFLAEIMKSFESDPIFSKDEDGYSFNVGECPFLNREASDFRRFSSKISGAKSRYAEKYIDSVQLIAQKYFGSRIYPWNDYFGGPNKSIHGPKCPCMSRIKKTKINRTSPVSFRSRMYAQRFLRNGKHTTAVWMVYD